MNISTDTIDNNEVISINNMVTTTGIICFLPLSNIVNRLHGTIPSNTLRKTLFKLLSIEFGRILGNKLIIILYNMIEISLYYALL